MKRLFWLAAGAAAAAVALHQLRRAAEEHPAARLVEKAVDSGIAKASEAAAAVASRATEAARGFVDDYRTASDERARELRDALLAETQGSEEELRARRDTARSAKARARESGEAAAWRRDVDRDEYAGDEAELGYEF